MAGILSQTIPLRWYWFLSLTLTKAADLDTLKKQGFILAHGFRVRVEGMAENSSHQAARAENEVYIQEGVFPTSQCYHSMNPLEEESLTR